MATVLWGQNNESINHHNPFDLQNTFFFFFQSPENLNEDICAFVPWQLLSFNSLTCLFQIKKVETSWDREEEDTPSSDIAETSKWKKQNW